MRQDPRYVHGGNVFDSHLAAARRERKTIMRKMMIAFGIILGYGLLQTGFAFLVGLFPK